MSQIHNFFLKSIDGRLVHLSDFKGKKMLLVNTASECRYTDQYQALQELHSKHGDKIAVLGFPSNQFGGQEPGSNDEIATFCETNYGVSFPLFEKIMVSGDEKHPLYDWLTDEDLNGWNSQEPNWNFCKYLVDEEGNLKKFFEASISPLSDEIING